MFGQALDAGITAHISPENMSVSCSVNSVTPIVTLQNFGTDTLKTVSVRYSVNGDPPISFDWTGALATDEAEDVTLTPFTSPAGMWTFTSFTDAPNGLPDEDDSNDILTTNHSTVNPVMLPFFEDFEDPAFNPTINDLVSANPDNDSFEWQRTTDASGFTQGTACAVFDNYEGDNNENPIGTEGYCLCQI